MVRFTIDNDITVENPPKELMKWCRDYLVLDNPDFLKLERMGKWTGRTSRYISLYEVIGSELHLPFGLLSKIYTMYPAPQYEWNVKIHDKKYVDYKSTIQLYDYQKEAAKLAVKKKNGILVMPCGSGKTQTALEIISIIGGRALWLTHTQDLLRQSMSRAKAFLASEGFGTITEGKVQIGESITFATVQTLSKINLERYKDCFDLIIVDECQHCCGSPTRVTQFYKVISSLSARYKIGLTATPKRADGLEQSMYALLGGIIYEVSREDIESKRSPVKVMTIFTGYRPSDDIYATDGTIDYNSLVEDLTENQERMDTVVSTLNRLDGSILVLANRVQYLKDLQGKYNGRSICLSKLGTSKAAKEERAKALKALDTGEIDAIFATYQLAKEGLDVPSLRYVVFATPEKDETTVVQSVGRVSRKAEGKEFGTVIDFVDDFRMFLGWYKKRVGYYRRKLGAEVT